MNNYRKVFSNNKLFFTGYLLILLFGAGMLLVFGKVHTFYLMNPYHHEFVNYIFYFFTILGDGLFYVPLAFSLLFIKEKKLFWLLLSSYVMSGVIVLILKNFIEEARPSVYAGLKAYPYFIDHITLHNYHGFPSGHTASAFAAASVLAFYSFSKRLTAMILLISAMLVGYSRIYLGEHFISDVMVGSFIGIVSGIICWVIVDNKMKPIDTSLQVK